MSLRSVCVFCGASPGANPVYREAAENLGRHLAERGLTLVYGGGAVGLCRINTRSGDVSQQNGAAVRCIRPLNTRLAERILP